MFEKDLSIGELKVVREFINAKPKRAVNPFFFFKMLCSKNDFIEICEIMWYDK